MGLCIRSCCFSRSFSYFIFQSNNHLAIHTLSSSRHFDSRSHNKHQSRSSHGYSRSQPKSKPGLKPRHIIPYRPPSRTITMPSYTGKTMSSDAASIQSSSTTMSTLKSLLHRNQALAIEKAAKEEAKKQEKAARKEQNMRDRRLNTEATFHYLASR